jgi:hypothetical protein
MLIESCSVPKFRDLSQPGDDILVVLPGRLYAVFDGATDTTGVQVHGGSPGRFAASQAALAMVAHATATDRLARSAPHWLAAMNQSIAQGLTEAGAAGLRAGSTCAVVEDPGDGTLRFLIVGDSSIRINGTELIRLNKDVDLIYAAGRVALFYRLQSLGLVGDALEAQARQLTAYGMGHAANVARAGLVPADIDAVLAEARRVCSPRLKSDAVDLVDGMLLAGIAGGQYIYCNQTGHSLAYAVLNGGPTQGPDLLSFTRPKSTVRSIELFTDGYMAYPQGTRVKDWEDTFSRVEEEDFSKTAAYAGVKGSTSKQFSDDRTVLVVHFSS